MLAQYTPPSVEPLTIINWAILAYTLVFVVIPAALGAVGAYMISVSIGKKIIAWFKG